MINKYPYTDFHELNLDWIIDKIKDVEKTLNEYVAVNKINWMGEWNISKSYPSWSIVDVNSEGYVSIKPVPAGVQINNLDYWTPVVNYTALYNAFNSRIEALESITDTLNDDLSSLTVRVNNLHRNKAVIAIGDSYEIGRNGYTGWGEELSALISETVTLYRYGEGSAGFAHKGDRNHNFKELLESVESEITNPESITDIVILGGINDMTDSIADITSGLNDLISYINVKYNAKIHIGFQGNKYRKTNEERNAYLAIISLLKSNAAILNYNYISNIEYIMHAIPFIQPDNVHATSEGSKYIARAAFSAIYNLSFNFTFQRAVTFNVNNTTVEGGLAIIDNETTMLLIPQMYNSSSITFTGSQLTTFCSMSNWLSDLNSSGQCVKIFSNDTNAPETCMMYVNDNVIYLQSANANTITVNGIQTPVVSISNSTLYC